MSPVKQTLYRGLAKAASLVAGAPGPGLRALMYHSVGGRLPSDPYGNAMSPALFSEHAQMLVREGSEHLIGRRAQPTSGAQAVGDRESAGWRVADDVRARPDDHRVERRSRLREQP